MSLDLSAITHPETKVLSFQCHTVFNPAVRNGGAEGIQTLDFYLARVALYQLSYSPIMATGVGFGPTDDFIHHEISSLAH